MTTIRTETISIILWCRDALWDDHQRPRAESRTQDEHAERDSSAAATLVRSKSKDAAVLVAGASQSNVVPKIATSRAVSVAVFLALLAAVAALAACGGSSAPESVSAADLKQAGEFWNGLPPDLKRELAATCKEQETTERVARFGGEDPAGVRAALDALPIEDYVAKLNTFYGEKENEQAQIQAACSQVTQALLAESLSELFGAGSGTSGAGAPGGEAQTPGERLSARGSPPAADKPSGDYSANCAYVLGDLTESARGYRFVADATLKNTGNVEIVVRASAKWNQAGGAPVSIVKTVRVPAGRNKNVHFRRLATADQIDLHQAAGGKCEVDVAIVGRSNEAGGEAAEPAGASVLRARLESAGYRVEAEPRGSGTPQPEGALRVPLDEGAQIVIYAYAEAGDAARVAKTFAPVERAMPKQLEVRRVGAHLYVGTVEEPAILPVAALARVVAVAEGKGR